MKIKTAELIGPALDWAVAKCLGLHRDDPEVELYVFLKNHDNGFCHYSTDWSQGGPIIEREKIDLENTNWTPAHCFARKLGDDSGSTRRDGSTLLIAAMRCYVASKLGDEVDVPEELE